jgi:hypothetical protein
MGWALVATLGGSVTNSKRRGWALGIVLGGLLGIFGLIIAALLRPTPVR